MYSRRAFDPWQVRRVRRLSNRLLRFAPWLWFGGLAVVLLVALLSRNDPWWVLLACALTVYPALFIWVGLPAFEGLWKLLLRAPVRARQSLARRLWWAALAAIGVVLVAAGLAPLLAAVWHLLAMP
jgi:hypothetical protein